MDNERLHKENIARSKKDVSDAGLSPEGMSATEKLLDAIGDLPEDMIGEASNLDALRHKWKRQRRYRHVLQISGGLVAAALFAIAIWGLGGDRGYMDRSDGKMSGIRSKSCEENVFDEAGEVSVAPMEIWNLSVEDTVQGTGALGEDTSTEETNETTEDTDQYIGSSKSAESALEKKSDDSASSASAEQQATEDADLGTGKGQRLGVGQVYPVEGTTTGKGKEKSFQFTLQFGREGDETRYRLKTSSNLSMELTAPPSDENNTRKLRGNKKSVVHCVAGTQIGCAVRLSEKLEPSEDITIAEWTEKDIHAIANISITARKFSHTSGEGKIVLGESGGRYYIVYLAE